jgi:Glycosyl transferase family 2
MGRPLVWLFLGSVAFGLITIAVGIVHLARDIWIGLGIITRPYGLLPSVPSIPHPLQWDGPWLNFAVWYFDIIAPLGLLLLFAIDKYRPVSVHRWREPEPFTVSGQKITAVLTAYNDESSIGLAVDEFRALPEVNYVVVVDNNCTDATAAVARSHGAAVVEETKQGYGFACMRGLRYALEETDANIIVLAEGDMTFFAEDLRKMLPYLHNCDMVLGTRTSRVLTRKGSQMDWFMSWGNLFLALLIRLRFWDWTFLGRVQLTDVGCTFRAMRRSLLQQLLGDLTVGGMYFSPHMILAALRERASVIEVPIQFRPRVGASKGAGSGRSRAVRIGGEMLWEIVFR